jgi:hypothetical protein
LALLDLQSDTDSWTAPVTIDGATLTLQGTVDYSLLSVQVRLRRYRPQYGRVSEGLARGARPAQYGRVTEGTSLHGGAQGPRVSRYDRLSIPRPSPPRSRQVELTAVFYAAGTIDILQNGSRVETRTARIVIEADARAGLFVRPIHNQFVAFLDLANTYIDDLRVKVLDVALPPAYVQKLQQALASPSTRTLLNRIIHRVGQQPQVPLLPASIDYSMDRPLRRQREVQVLIGEHEEVVFSWVSGREGLVVTVQDYETHFEPAEPAEWFHVSAPTPNLVWTQFDGCLVAAIDVPGYTAGSLEDLRDFRADDPAQRDCDFGGSVNLQFLEDFLSREVFPVMRDGYVTRDTLLNKVNYLHFVPVATVDHNGRPITRPGFELELDVTYWTGSFVDFNIRGTNQIDVTATVRGYPYFARSELTLAIVDIDLDLPWWVWVGAGLGLGLLTVSIPVGNFLIPAIALDLVRETKRDVIRYANGEAAGNALRLESDFTFPGADRPIYHLTPTRFAFDTTPDSKHATLLGRASRKLGAGLQVSFEGRTIDVPSDDPSYTIRKEWALPPAIWAGVEAHGAVQDHDPTCRVRWQTFLNGRPVPEYTRDFPYADSRAKGLGIQTFHVVNPNRTDQELEVQCRFYRTIGPTTQDILNSSVRFISDDPRPDSVKPYVRWSHNVRYWDGYRSRSVRRRSKIHKAPGKGGCRFSNQHLISQRHHSRWKDYEVRYLTELPFDERFIERYRNEVCPYCFFGGPDKHAGDPIDAYDISGVVGKLYTYAHEFVPP